MCYNLSEKQIDETRTFTTIKFEILNTFYYIWEKLPKILKMPIHEFEFSYLVLTQKDNGVRD